MTDTARLIWGLETPGLLPDGEITAQDLWFGSRRDNPAVNIDVMPLFDGDLAGLLPWLQDAPMPSAEDVEGFLSQLDVYMGMLDRTEFGRNAPYPERRNFLFLVLRAALGMLASRRFRYAFFIAPPHFAIDAVLADTFARHRVPVYYGYQSLVPDRFFILDHRLAIVPPPEPSAVAPMPRVEDEQLFYMLNVKARRRTVLDVAGVWLRVALGRVKGGAYFALRRILMQIQFQRDLAAATRIGGDIAAVEQAIAGIPFVYFPLHMQPEMNTSFLGGARHHDQARVVEDLLAALPEGWLLLLKENPKQDWRLRHPAFFRRVLADPRVRFVDRAVPGKLLLRHARLVATVTGTAGWEVVRMGRRVVHFGRCWYASLPGAHRWSPDLDLAALAAEPLDVAEVEAGYGRLMALAWPGIVDCSYQAISRDGMDVNPARLSAALGNLPRAASPVTFVGRQ